MTNESMTIERAVVILNAAGYQVRDGWQVSNDRQWAFQHPDPDTVIRKPADDVIAIAYGLIARAIQPCRALEDGSNHVSYAASDEGIERENLTHRESIEVGAIEERGEFEVSWIADAGENVALESIGLVRVFICDEPEAGFTIDHQITIETAEQLSDMFRRAAEVAWLRLAVIHEQQRKSDELAASQQSLFPDKQ